MSVHGTVHITHMLDHDAYKFWPIRVKQINKKFLDLTYGDWYNKLLLLHWFWELVELFLVLRPIDVS